MDPIYPIAPVSTPRITPVPPAPRVERSSPDGRRQGQQQPGDDLPQRRRRPDQAVDNPPPSRGVTPAGGCDDGEGDDDGPDLRPHIDITV